MKLSDLASKFASLSTSTTLEEKKTSYDAITLEEGKNFFLAKLQGNLACLLIATTDHAKSYPTPILLENIRVQHGIVGFVHGQELAQDQKFSVITLTNSDIDLLNIFLRFAVFLCSTSPDSPTSKEVGREIRRLVDMLQCLKKPCKRSIQGLWAEMLLIAESDAPVRWFEAWHKDPFDLHDFCFSEGRVEVKSTSSGSRIHHFSHRQLWPPQSKPLVVASVIVDADASGNSVFELAAQIRSHLSQDAAMRLDRIMLDSLGSDFARAGEFCFDHVAAKSSVQYYPVDTIPRLSEEMPDEISEISYSVKLSQLEGRETVDWLR